MMRQSLLELSFYLYLFVSKINVLMLSIFSQFKTQTIKDLNQAVRMSLSSNDRKGNQNVTWK